MDSEMTQDILFENEQKYFSRLKHADTVVLIGVGTERYSTVVCSSKSFWYELLKFRFDFPYFYLVHHSQNGI